MNIPESLVSDIKTDREIRQILNDFVHNVLEQNIDRENEDDTTYYCDDCSYAECYNYDEECDCCCHEEYNGYVEESRSAIVNYVINTFIPNHIIPKVAQNDTQP